MKTKYSIILFFLFSLSIFAQSGFKAGVNISNFYGANANMGGNAHNNFVAPSIGYFKDWNIAKDPDLNYYFSIGFEAGMSIKGAIIRNKITYSEVSPFEIWDISDREMSMYFLEFPHVIKFHYCFSKNIQTQLYGGGILSFDIIDFTKTLKHSNPDYSYNGGSFFLSPDPFVTPPSFLVYSLLVGVAFSYKQFLIDMRYIRGVTEIYSGTYLDTISFSVGYVL